MIASVVAFALVYLGMIGGGLPFLQLDRTGVALLGAIALVAAEAVTPAAAAGAIHLPTLILLFSFMVISAHLELAGFHGWVAHRIASLPLSPPALLGVLMGAAAGLAAVFSNDIVCLAMAPILADAAVRRGLDPVPFLLALACSANIGSAATLIGNPQNMLIGSTLGLSFPGYFLRAVGPVVAGLGLTWLVVAARTRGRWLSRPGPLFAATFLLSNVVSNVPAVMLLLPVASHPGAGPLLALVSTLAGNLLVVGSIANIIVVDAAAKRGIAIDWRTHARVGVPVTLVTLAAAAAFLSMG
jgi:Na+/H+ antiporter NhaD/arsenite permease-like protein